MQASDITKIVKHINQNNKKIKLSNVQEYTVLRGYAL